MRIQVYCESGSYGCLDTTMLSFQDGCLAADSFLDASDLAGRVPSREELGTYASVGSLTSIILRSGIRETRSVNLVSVTSRR